MAEERHQLRLRELLKRTSAALTAGEVDHALCGGYALWALGAPEPVHDADVLVAEEDLPAAVAALRAAGLTVDDPPEDWLVKVVDGPAGGVAFVDVIHRTNGVPATRAMFADSPRMEVLSVTMPVLPPTEVFVMRLLALSDHFCDFSGLLPAARAVREQIDWPRLRERTAANPYAEAFLFLLDRLGITDTGGGAG